MPLNNPTDLASPAAIGSITPNTIAATTVNASATTASTSTTTGAIVTPGGGGFGGSLFLGGGVNAVSAALRSGSFTSTIVPATLSANQTIITPNNSGTIALLSDITSTGVQKLYVNNVASAALTGTTVETTFLTFTIPGNTVGGNGCLDIEELVGGVTNNANVKTLRVKIGANTIFAAPMLNLVSFRDRRTLRCQNSQSSQVIYPAGSGGSFVTTFAMSTFAIDFTVDQVVTITGQLGAASDSMQLRGTTFLLY